MTKSLIFPKIICLSLIGLLTDNHLDIEADVFMLFVIAINRYMYGSTMNLEKYPYMANRTSNPETT